MQFFRGSRPTPGRIRSEAGVASALAVLLSFPAAILGEVLGLDTSMTLHLFLGIGMLLLACAAFQFDLLVLPIVIVVTLIKQIPGVAIGDAVQAIALLLVAFAWFLFASLQSRRESSYPADPAFTSAAAAPL
jgi:hypothetical protein